jgi:D-galacturonate reductase
MVGVNGNKFPEIRAHLQHNIAQVYKDLDVSYVVWFRANSDDMVLGPFLSDSIASQETRTQIRRLVRPNCDMGSPYYLHRFIDKVAIDKLNPGDAVVIFTPDSKCFPVHVRKSAVRRALILEDTHYAIARYAIEHGLHVLVTKPATQLLSHHLELIDLSRKHNVVCFVEHHKRFVLFSKPTLCS